MRVGKESTSDNYQRREPLGEQAYSKKVILSFIEVSEEMVGANQSYQITSYVYY